MNIQTNRRADRIAVRIIAAPLCVLARDELFLNNKSYSGVLSRGGRGRCAIRDALARRDCSTLNSTQSFHVRINSMSLRR